MFLLILLLFSLFPAVDPGIEARNAANAYNYGAVHAQDLLFLKGHSDGLFTTTVGFGTPRREFSCVVDTGSSNLAVAGFEGNGTILQHYNTSWSTTAVRHPNKSPFTVSFAEKSSFTAIRVTDVVQIGPSKGLALEFGVIINFTGGLFKRAYGQPSPFECVLGIGGEPIMPLDDPLPSLLAASTNSNVVAVATCPGVERRNEDGLMYWGGYPGSVPQGPVFTLSGPVYRPIVTEMRLGETVIGVPCNTYNLPVAPLLDSGSSHLVLPSVVFRKIVQMLEQRIADIGYEVPKELWDGDTCLSLDNIILKYLPTLTITLALEDDLYGLEVPILPSEYLRYTAFQSIPCAIFRIREGQTDSPTVLGVPLWAHLVISFNLNSSQTSMTWGQCIGNDDDQLVVTRLSTLTHDCVNPTPLSKIIQTLGWLGIAVACILALVGIVYIVRRWRGSSHRYVRLSDLQDDGIDLQTNGPAIQLAEFSFLA